MGKPMGVVVNRAGVGNDEIYRFCGRKEIPFVAEIPFARAAAEAYARGGVIADVSKEYRDIFVSMYGKICELAVRPASVETAHA